MKKFKLHWLVAATVLMCSASLSAQAFLAIVAHPSNPTSGITAHEAEQLFLGKTSELNGRRASPIDQAPGSAARAKFLKSVLKKDEAEMSNYWSKLQFTGKAQPPREAQDDTGVKALIVASPEAIGYVDGKSVDGSVKVLLIIP
jgi:ABC-type phosphate transport system substrate-binding protein